MPLLLLDLDNTLVDREGAFRAWASAHLDERGLSSDLLDAMVEIDGDGLRDKSAVARDLIDLLRLQGRDAEQIVTTLRAGVVAHLGLVPGCVEALNRASAAGWTPFVVTNGVVAQQQSKMSKLGLDEVVAGWVISDEIGIRKPDPRIFHVAAERAGQSLDAAWMIGDAAHTDIAGAQAVGIDSVYLSRGREWPREQQRPTAIADSFVAAVEAVLAAGNTGSASPQGNQTKMVR